MSAVPTPCHTLVASIYRWRQDLADTGLRAHLGASLIGHECVRYLWLSFRWTANMTWEGRMLRLFDRGQREESVMIAELRGIGAEVSEGPAPGEQWRLSACGGHFGGSMDAVVRGLPGGSATQWEVAEFKTSNDAGFKALCKQGIAKAKPMHYRQIQTYLELSGMERGNYLVVNKNDDSLYYERIRSDRTTGKAMLARAESVIFAVEPPPPISRDPSWFQCRGCHFHAHCHGAAVPLVTCRSCAHATPESDGTWQCEYHRKSLDTAMQRSACLDHRYIPVLLSGLAEMTDASQEDNCVAYRHRATGTAFVNGAHGLSSAAIFEAASA